MQPLLLPVLQVLPLHELGDDQVRLLRKFVILSFLQVAKAEICNPLSLSQQVSMAEIYNLSPFHLLGSLAGHL